MRAARSSSSASEKHVRSPTRCRSVGHVLVIILAHVEVGPPAGAASDPGGRVGARRRRPRIGGRGNPMSLAVHLVTDRLTGDPACAELERRLAAAFPRAVVRATFVAPHDALAAAHRVARLAGRADAGDRVVAHDAAAGPRQPGPWPAGAGERLFVARSVAGALVVGSNVGWTWSCVVADL